MAPGSWELLGEAELEEGTCSQIRLVLGDNNELVVNGESYPLQTPSAPHIYSRRAHILFLRFWAFFTDQPVEFFCSTMVQRVAQLR